MLSFQSWLEINKEETCLRVFMIFKTKEKIDFRDFLIKLESAVKVFGSSNLC